MKHITIILLALIGLVSCNDNLTITLTNPNVEQQFHEQPLATAQPRFSWNYETTENEVVQQNYRIIVATTVENAQNGVGDLWDSGVVPSNQMLYIPYAGKPLQSRDKAYWKVITTVAAKGKKAKVESEVKSFEISLLNQDDWQAKWIGHEFEDDVLVGKTRLAARYLRKDFALKNDIKEARLYVSGMGVYSAYLNGCEVAPEELLKPTLSWYSKRVYFNTYDVTNMLQQGDNAIGVILEGGRYTSIRYNEANPNWDGTNHVFGFGTPRLLLQLEVTYKDGQKETIVSDETWKITNRGPIRTANEWDGETYDENFDLGDWNKAGYDASSWLQAELVEAPEGELSAQPNPNITVMEKLKPISLFQKGDKWYLDMGQNMVGFIDMKARGQQPGDIITLRFAELLTPDSLLYTANLRSSENTDQYIVANNSKLSTDSKLSTLNSQLNWHPMFVYHGFRYVEISGLRETPNMDDFEGCVIYDEMPVTGSFETSNEIINAHHGQLRRVVYLQQPPALRQVALRWRRLPMGQRLAAQRHPALLARLHRQHDLAWRHGHRDGYALYPLRRRGAHPSALRSLEEVDTPHEERLYASRPHASRHLRRLVHAAREPRTHPLQRPHTHHRRNGHLHAILLLPLR